MGRADHLAPWAGDDGWISVFCSAEQACISHENPDVPENFAHFLKLL
jgi:hypothetical protein